MIIIVLLPKSAGPEENLRVMALEQTSYLDETYTSMALLISLLEKKNILLKYIKKCDETASPEKMASSEYKEKLAWVVIPRLDSRRRASISSSLTR